MAFIAKTKTIRPASKLMPEFEGLIESHINIPRPIAAPENYHFKKVCPQEQNTGRIYPHLSITFWSSATEYISY
jgi:hypothetical protein